MWAPGTLAPAAARPRAARNLAAIRTPARWAGTSHFSASARCSPARSPSCLAPCAAGPSRLRSRRLITDTSALITVCLAEWTRARVSRRSRSTCSLRAQSRGSPARNDAAEEGAADRQRGQRSRGCEDRGVRHRHGQPEAADDPVPGEDWGSQALPGWQLERRVMRDEVPGEHERAADFDQRPEIEDEVGARAQQTESEDRGARATPARVNLPQPGGKL